MIRNPEMTKKMSTMPAKLSVSSGNECPIMTQKIPMPRMPSNGATWRNLGAFDTQVLSITAIDSAPRNARDHDTHWRTAR